MNDQIQEIINDIKDDRCVLVLGPDLHDFGDKTFFQMMCEDFAKNDKAVLDDLKEYVFLNEELLQLKPGKRNETKAARMMKRFYEKQIMFDEPLKKISQIPFPLIISLMPDDRLRKIFDEQGFPYLFDYFPIKKPMHKIEGKPTKQTPLIYNLLGDFTQEGDNYLDVVITFDNMFHFLSTIIKDGLPTPIEACLENAETFIFLGVHFERWHAQLLLKLILRNGLKYTIAKNGYNNDASSFIGRRFELELELFGNEPVNFLDEIYAGCIEKNLLKQPPPPPFRATVFLSYNHKDKSAVEILSSALVLNNIDVIIDETEMLVGQNIDEFILKIREVDCLIPIISINSLCSPYVIKEIDTGLNMQKKIIPYYLDNALNEDATNDIKRELVNIKLGEIGRMIAQNIKGKLDNLLSERIRWTEYDENFPRIVNELKRVRGRLINVDDIDNTIKLIVKDIALKINE